MRRWAPFIAAMALASAAVAQDAPGAGEAWFKTLIRRDWIYVDVGGDFNSVAYRRPAVQVPPYKRLWVRYELRSQSAGYPNYRSYVSLNEYDCAQARERRLQTTYYENQNLTGATVTVPTAAWEYTQPSTMQEAVYNIACARASISQ
jgi:hypothetical protein